MRNSVARVWRLVVGVVTLVAVQGAVLPAQPLPRPRGLAGGTSTAAGGRASGLLGLSQLPSGPAPSVKQALGASADPGPTPSSSREQELRAPDAAPGDSFGWSVSLSALGDVALIGAYDKDGGEGTAYECQEAISKLIRADLVMIDDVGLLLVSADAAETLFRVIDAAYEKRSSAISSNIHLSGSTN